MVDLKDVIPLIKNPEILKIASQEFENELKNYRDYKEFLIILSSHTMERFDLFNAMANIHIAFMCGMILGKSQYEEQIPNE